MIFIIKVIRGMLMMRQRSNNINMNHNYRNAGDEFNHHKCP